MNDDVVIRAEQPDDLDAVAAVITAAFGNEGRSVADIWRTVRDQDDSSHGFVAVHDNQIVGHVGLSHAWLDARRELVDIVTLSPLSVRPVLQANGIGTRLLRAAVEDATRRTPLLVLEGDPGYYGDRGFVPTSDFGVSPASDRVPGPASQCVLGAGYEEWMRGRVVYPDLWWRGGAVGLRDPDLARVESAFGIEPR